MEVIPLHDRSSSHGSTAPLRLQEESETTNNSKHIETSLVPDIEPETLPPSTSVNPVGYSLLTEKWVENPNKKCFHGTKWSSERNDSDNFRPERPPKPAKKDSTEKQMNCLCMTMAENLGTTQGNVTSKDSGYNSAESRESIPEMPLENKNTWQIELDELKILDKVLGKGEFGIVKKGLYRGKEVAVKQSKGKKLITTCLIFHIYCLFLRVTDRALFQFFRGVLLSSNTTSWKSFTREQCLDFHNDSVLKTTRVCLCVYMIYRSYFLFIYF